MMRPDDGREVGGGGFGNSASECSWTAERSSALIDGELDAVERARLQKHVADCDSCRQLLARTGDELRHLSQATAQFYSDLIAAAPPPPPTLGERWAPLLSRNSDSQSPVPSGEPPWQESSVEYPDRNPAGPDRNTSRRGWFGNMWIRTATGVSVATSAALVLLSLIPRGAVSASPHELIDRVAKHYSELRDMELRVTPESEALDLLATLFDTKPKSSGRNPMDAFRVLLRAPNRFVVDLSADDAEIRLEDGVLGFDGRDFWGYSKVDEVIELSALEDNIEVTSTDSKFSLEDLENIDLLHYLTWGFLERLREESKYEIVEVTGPYERRVGHRAFQLDWLREEGEEKSLFVSRSHIVVDPRTNLIERMVFDLNLGGLSLFKLRIELVEVDQGLPEMMFDPKHYSSDKVPLVRVEKGEEKEEKSDDK